MACSEWKVPWAPVKPWVMTRVSLSTRMAMLCGFLHCADDLLGGIREVVGRDDGQAGLRHDLLAEGDIGALQPDDQRHGKRDFTGGGDDALGDHVAAHD